ncbi:MAG: hypothetical protein PCFJNLEI_04218 [Verrucomicrobiae bacterium]|nr:hypothetical protein [Verrucomicrobiae bacterium]
MALTFVSAAPSIVSELPFAGPVPTVMFWPRKFQAVLARIATVLFELPLPTTKAPLRTVALVTVSVLFFPPSAPMVIAPFDTTLPTVPPSIRYVLLLLPSSPTLTAPLKNEPPSRTQRPLLAEVAALPPMVTTPALVITPSASTMTQLLLALPGALPTDNALPRRLMVALLPPPLAPLTYTVLLWPPQPVWPLFWPTNKPVAMRTKPPFNTNNELLPPTPEN